MCCTPYIATVIAGVLGIVESLRGLGWNLEIVLIISGQEANYSFVPPILSAKNLNQENLALYGVAVASILLHALWFVFACLMLAGNATMKRGLIWPWLAHTQIMTMLAVFMGIFYFVKYAQIYGQRPEIRMKRSSYFRLGVGYSGWFYIWPFMNAIFTVHVSRRIIEISKDLMREAAANNFLNHTRIGQRPSDPPPYMQAVAEADESTSILQTVTSYITSRRTPPARPPPPDINRVSGWSHQNLLRNDVLSTENQDSCSPHQENATTNTTAVDVGGNTNDENGH